jgi:spore germination cell wall hydrolase CwlJ-like protein
LPDGNRQSPKMTMREIMDRQSMPHWPRAGIAGLLFAAVAAIPAALILWSDTTIADTPNWGAKIRAQEHWMIRGLPDQDPSAFAETENFRRVARFPTTNVAIDVSQDTDAIHGETREALAALTVEDAETATEVSGARSQAITDQLTTDAVGVIDLSEINSVEVGERSKQWRCLTEALYFEARGEELEGQVAVAEVILNRVDADRYQDSVCAVVHQGERRPTGCQFSFICDGKAETIGNRAAFEELGKVAWVMLHGKPRILTGKATHYHNTSVAPRWAKKLVRTTRIGAHIFYRPGLKLTSR